MSESHTFQAEVTQLLDLVIHSLYSDREIFLRELVSNASDAIDRARVMGLSRDDLREGGEPRIEVSVDAEKGTITVRDNGIGLTAEQAREHLGTIAKSGTRAFAEAIQQGEKIDNALIGQFGVGFYSALMVADRLAVHSLSGEPDAEAITWTCDGTASYTLGVGTRTERGTDITLQLKDDAKEFLDLDTLRRVVRKHSEFVSFPIFLDDTQVNESTALWTRDPNEVTEEEYKAFYKHVGHDWADPARWLHVKADTPVDLSAVLFLPAQKPFDMNWTDGKRHVRLYSKKVLILEEARKLLPDYLRFIRGVVDSEDIQLNVSRELVQSTPTLDTIRAQLVTRVLKDLSKWAKKDEEAYADFWRSFGTTLKEGVHTDADQKKRLVPLLRFNTTRHDDGEGVASLASIVEAMPEDQDTLWYLTGPDRGTCARSPHLEAFKKRGWEVILLTDPVDEWLVGSVTEFEGKELKSVARGELDLEEPETSPETEALIAWLGDVLGDSVAEVRASSRLTDSPSVLVDSDHGMGANMERILRRAQQDVPASQRILEVNLEHPLVVGLATLREADAEQARPLGRLLLDQAQLVEGTVADPAGLVSRLQTLSALAAKGLGVEVELPVPPEAEVVAEAVGSAEE